MKNETAMMIGAAGAAGLFGLGFFLKSRGGDKLPLEIQLKSIWPNVITVWARQSEEEEYRMWNGVEHPVNDLDELYVGDHCQISVTQDCILSHEGFETPLLSGNNSLRW